jgi:hypothetical protein
MPSTINASNSGSGGLISTGDASGVLQLQTASTAALTIDANQRTAFVAGTAALPAITTTGDTNTGIFFPAADTIAFSEGGTESMRIDSSGNVGIGTSSPTGTGGYDKALDVVGGSNGAGLYIRGATNPSTVYAAIQYDNGSNRTNINAIGTNNFMRFVTVDTERMRIDSSGSVGIGTTSAASSRLSISGTATLCMMKNESATSGTAQTTILFRDNGDNTRGSITVSTSGTVYNTTSDYRLKENITPMIGALAKISQLKPVTYKWKETGDSGQGFIAHELAEVVPECVTGEKDAVETRDGKEFIVPQGIDTSFLVATLTAALQETKALIDTQAELISGQAATINALVTRIEALENK